MRSVTGPVGLRWPFLWRAPGLQLPFGVSGGRQLSGSTAYGFAAVVALLGGGLALVLSKSLSAAARRAFAAGRRRHILVASFGVFVLLEIINAVVLPRLYPAFHLALAIMAAMTGGLLTLGIDYQDARRRRKRLGRSVAALATFAVCAALSPHAAQRLSHLDNIRFIYHQRAPMLSQVLLLGAEIAPPKPLADDSSLQARPIGGPALPLRGRDVLLITIDALRADHVGAYGYERATTPNIDALAAEGLVFDAAYTPTPHTSYAVTSMLTGKYMRPLILQGLGTDSETWATHLRRYGYRTAGFYPPAVFFIDGDKFGAFKKSQLGFEYQKVEFASAEQRVEQVSSYLETVSPEQRVFLWVHLFEPHEPYEAHAKHPFGERDIGSLRQRDCRGGCGGRQAGEAGA